MEKNLTNCWAFLAQFQTRARQQILFFIDDKKYLLPIQRCELLCGLAKN
jgi:hypothetical protein